MHLILHYLVPLLKQEYCIRDTTKYISECG